MDATYQDDGSRGSDEGVQQPALQRQPTAAGTGRKEQLAPSNTLADELMAHARRTIVFGSIVGGGVPYAATISKLHRIIKCWGDFKQCLCFWVSSWDTTRGKLGSCCAILKFDWIQGTLFMPLFQDK